MIKRPTPWEQLDGVKFTLEQILEQAVEWERSRIIKLLEDDLAALKAVKSEWNIIQAEAIEELIALIKGEFAINENNFSDKENKGEINE